MAQNDGYDFNLDYPVMIEMNDELNIEATICNIILDTADTYHTVKLESPTLGTHTLTESDNETYIYSELIPPNPEYFPEISGEISLYEGPLLITSEPFSFEIYYGLDYEFQTINNSDTQNFTIYANLTTHTGNIPLDNGEAYIEVYLEGIYQEKKYCSIEQVTTPTVFSKSISLSQYGEYRFDMYLDDGINSTDHLLGTYSFEHIDYSGSQEPEPDPDPTPDTNTPVNQSPIPVFAGVMVPSIGIPSGIIGFVLYRKKLQSDT
jgi:hypothetical protein